MGFIIKTSRGYYTMRGFISEPSFTENINFAYCFETAAAAENAINSMGIKAEIERL